MVTTNRYRDLLSLLPPGKDFENRNEWLPFRDAPYEFQFQTTLTEQRFSVLLNDVRYPDITTDVDGLAIFRTVPALEPDDYTVVIEAVNALNPLSYQTTFAIRNIATWFASWAEVLEELDDEIEQMRLAQSIDTVTAKYIADVYGQRVRQSQPSTYLLNEYRKMLIAMRPAYRHFGAHPYGLSQIVEAFTSVSPFTVPTAWRPHFKCGTQLLSNGNFQTRSRVWTQELAPAGATNLVRDLPLINRQSRVYVHPSLTGTVTTANLRQPPTPQHLSVTFTAALAVTIVGLDELGETVSEVVPDPSIVPASGETYATETIFSAISSVSNSGTACSVGLADDRFVSVLRVGDHNLPSSAVDLTFYGATTAIGDGGLFQLAWGNGDTVTVPTANVATLLDIGRMARINGLVELAAGGVATYDLNPSTAHIAHYHDRLILDVDRLGVLSVDLGAGTPIASINIPDAVTAINDAFDADVRYPGTDYTGTAYSVAGTEGDDNECLTLQAFERTSTLNDTLSSIKFAPGPCDASIAIFGLPRTSSHLVVGVVGSTVVVGDGDVLPVVKSTDTTPFRRRYKARIRGLRKTVESGDLSAIDGNDSSVYMSFSLDNYTFTAADIGGWVRWVDASNSDNDGIHRIIAVDSGDCTLIHEKSGDTPQGLFGVVGATTGEGAVYGKGEILTVQDVTGSTVTFTAAPAYAWPAAAIFELVNETPYTVGASDGLGELDIELNSDMRPYHDFGGAISHVAGNTWALTSARANFTGLTIGTILRLADCENEENDGDFAITAVTSATEIRFTNALGIAEGSSTAPTGLEWSLDVLDPSDALIDPVTPLGALLPDEWFVSDGTATVQLANDNINDSVTGLLVPSRTILTTSADVSIQTNCAAALNYKGLPLTISFWLQEFSEDETPYTIDVSFNDGTDFFEVVSSSENTRTILVADTLEGPLNPFKVSGSFFVPYDAETCIIRLTRELISVDPASFSIEKATLTSETGSGLFLGRNTVIRHAKRAKFGEVLYVWASEELTTEEKTDLGLPLDTTSLPALPGHIDRVVNSHGWWDRVDVSEFDDSTDPSTRNNLRGEYDSIDWLAADSDSLLSNMEVVVGTPSKMSHVRPTRLSRVELEELALVDAGGGDVEATLVFSSNHTGTFPQDPNTGLGSGARLYEVREDDTTLVNADGLVTVIPAGTLIPVPDTLDDDSVQPWVFTAADTIKIFAEYLNTSATYVFDYDVLMQATTRPFAIEAAGADATEYVWLADLAAYKRHEVEELQRERVVQVSFDADFTASIKERADLSLESIDIAQLVQDNGSVQTTIHALNWGFVDSKTIRIDAGLFDANSIYELTYTARVPHIETPVEITLEWRASNDEADLTDDLIDWVEIENGQVLTPFHDTGDDVATNNVLAFHQLRVTCKGVEDVRDLRVFGLGVKGIRLFAGDDSNAPGIITPLSE